jgi:hypothetical protein
LFKHKNVENSAINKQTFPTSLMIEPHSWRAPAVNVIMHMHSGSQPDGSATPETGELFNIQPGFEIPGPPRSKLILSVGFCHG